MIAFATGAYALRSGAYLDLTHAWTMAGWYTPGATTPSGHTFRTFVNFGDPNGTDAYIYIGSDFDTNNLFVETWDGAILTDSVKIATVPSTAIYIGLTYDGAGTLTLLVNSSVIGTLAINLAGVSFPIQTDQIGGSYGDFSVAYRRVWQRVLSGAQLTAESLSLTPVGTSNLLTDTPLQASIDLTAHNNTATQWVPTGTITTNTTDPLLSVVAGPPTNTTPATATRVTIDSAYFQDVNIAGVATDVWHKITAPVTGTVVLGAMAFGDLVTYTPRVRVYEGLANAEANNRYLTISGGDNTPIQFPVTAGADYYFKSERTGVLTASTLQFSVLSGLNLPVPIGSIAINDDSGFINTLVFIDPLTGYPIRFLYPFTPFGEGGGTFDDGTVVVCENENLKPNLYNAAMELLGEIDLVDYDVLSSNAVDTFLIGEPNLHRFQLVNGVGNVAPTVYNVAGGAGVLGTAGLNTTATKAYYASINLVAAPIKTWNIVTNSADPDLVAGLTDYYTRRGGIIVLKDGTILVSKVKITAPQDCLVKRYNTAGAELASYPQGANGNLDFRIATAVDNPNSFYTWTKLSPGARTSRFQRIKVSDGSVLSTSTGSQYIIGTCVSTLSATPERFGHPESCPFWITRAALFPPTPPPAPPAAGCPTGLSLQPVSGRPGCTDGV